MQNRKDVTVSLEKAEVDAIEDDLDYGDSRSAWIRTAVQQRLQRKGLADLDVDAEVEAD